MSTPAVATTEWVPLWDLTGGVNLDYKGAWAAGTYKEGEIVIDQGVAYLCTRTTTQKPVPWAAPPPSPSYGTTLPASPVNGQEHVLVDSVTAPTYQWRLRFNSQSSSAYKWEFIGGAPSAQYELTSVGISPAPTWNPTGPLFAIPRAGTYIVDFQLMFYAGALGAYIDYGIVGPYPPGSALISVSYSDRLAAVNTAEVGSIRVVLTITSPMTICGGSRYNENAITSANRSLIVTPVRVA